MTALLRISALTIPILCGCVSAPRISGDSDYNYATVFSGMREPKPVIINSRLERYTKSIGPLELRERNGEWEFEIIAPRSWVKAARQGFRPASGLASFRKPDVSWWRFTVEDYDAFEMPYSSYAAAHLYIEKRPKDEDHIHVFIQRH